MRESPAKGFDDDALQLLKVFGIGQGPDMFIAAHEWTCAFQRTASPSSSTITSPNIPSTSARSSRRCGHRPSALTATYAIPQDAEARMFFYNKKLLREAGYDDAFIEAMPERTLKGDLTMDELLDIAKQVVDKTKVSTAFFTDRTKALTTSWSSMPTAMSSSILRRAICCWSATSWRPRSAGSSAGVKEGVIPANNTAMEFDALRKEF